MMKDLIRTAWKSILFHNLFIASILIVNYELIWKIFYEQSQAHRLLKRKFVSTSQLFSFVKAIYKTDVNNLIAWKRQSDVWSRLKTLYMRILNNLENICQNSLSKSMQWEDYEIKLIFRPFWWGSSSSLMKYLMMIERFSI